MEFKTAKARAVSTLFSSEEGKVRHASKKIKCSRKWRPQQAVTEAEAHWRHREIVGVVCQGRLGLGNYDGKRWSKAKAKRAPVVQRVREAAEEDRQVKAIGLASQVADLMPTPSNLKIWGAEEDPSCKLCRAACCTLNHILTGCPKALAEGR
ncbi:hypothetical protein G5714_008721 [Xyrichtys novacula]|uniref:Uncharacterized protein n=1 Tax=Xyrichtys novacula TaxID=13765 RepID=A0AAV1HDN5_XYRNO|nr:hypothetical protein G5714_008721 [Xyrichtys novacula]